MINKLKLVLSIGLVSIASNAFGFDIDINQDDLKRLKYGFLVEDLAVGEKAFGTHMEPKKILIKQNIR